MHQEYVDFNLSLHKQMLVTKLRDKSPLLKTGKHKLEAISEQKKT